MSILTLANLALTMSDHPAYYVMPDRDQRVALRALVARLAKCYGADDVVSEACAVVLFETDLV